jgi:ATP-dependent Clp protease, proteolytic subunit ClpP
MCFLLLLAGAKGKRSRIVIHQPSSGFQGQATDIEIHANEIQRVIKRLNQSFEKQTKSLQEKIEKMVETNKFLNSKEAKKIVLIDKVIA